MSFAGSVGAFFNGYNNQSDADLREVNGKLRNSILQREVKQAEEEDKLRELATQEVAKAREQQSMASEGVGAIPQVTTPTVVPSVPNVPVTPSMAAGGLDGGNDIRVARMAQPIPAPTPVQSLPNTPTAADMQQLPNTTAQPPAQPTPQRVDVTGQRSLDDEYRIRRDFYVKNGRPDLADKVDAQWTRNLQNESTRLQSRYDQLVTKSKMNNFEGDANAVRASLLQERLGVAAKLMELKPGQAAAAKMFNDINKEFGLFADGNEVAGAAVDKNADPTKTKIVLIGKDGQPVKNKDGEQMDFTQEQWNQLTGRSKFVKFETVKPDEKIVGITPQGKSVDIASGGPARPKPGEENPQVKNASSQIDGLLGVDYQTGRMTTDTPLTNRVRASAKALAQQKLASNWGSTITEQQRGFEAGRQAYLEAAEQELRSALSAGDKVAAKAAQDLIDRARIPGSQTDTPNTAQRMSGTVGAPSPNSAIDQMRQRFGY